MKSEHTSSCLISTLPPHDWLALTAAHSLVARTLPVPRDVCMEAITVSVHDRLAWVLPAMDAASEAVVVEADELGTPLTPQVCSWITGWALRSPPQVCSWITGWALLSPPRFVPGSMA